MLSVIHVMAAFPVFSETFVSNEIRALRAMGHRVTPLALGPFDGPIQPRDEGLRAETVMLSSVPPADALRLAAARPDRLARAAAFALSQRGVRPRSLLYAGARVAVAARRAGATHIHAHMAHVASAAAIVAARLTGLTCSFTGHGSDVYSDEATDLAVKLRGADVAVAVCEDMRRDLLAIEPRARVRTVPCGVDPSLFAPVAAGAPRNGRLLFVGRLVPPKGLPVLLEALALVPADSRPRVDLVGSGELREGLEARVAELGLGPRVSFLGPRPSTWIAAEGPAYDGFVAPFVPCADGVRDTGPVVVKEAMAMGLPVVTSAQMGMKDTVTPECGRLVPPGDVAGLAGALRWLAALPPGERDAMGAAGRARVSASFSLESQARGVADAIAEVSAR